MNVSLVTMLRRLTGRSVVRAHEVFQSCSTGPTWWNWAFSSEKFKRVFQTVFHYNIKIVNFRKSLYKIIRLYKAMCIEIYMYLKWGENSFICIEITML